MTTIYALCAPDTGEIRYVGKTVGPVVVRLRSHAQDVKNALRGRAFSPEHRAKINAALRDRARRRLDEKVGCGAIAAA